MDTGVESGSGMHQTSASIAGADLPGPGSISQTELLALHPNVKMKFE